MNEKQIAVLNAYTQEVKVLVNKINDFEIKFFKKDGVLNPQNPRKNMDLQIGVYLGGTGQNIVISKDLLPVVESFVTQLKEYYEHKLEDISVDELCTKLKEETIKTIAENRIINNERAE